MTAAWELELVQLRHHLGPLQAMRMRWKRKSHIPWGQAWWELLSGAGRIEELRLALYPVDAEPGSRPLVEVEVAPNEPVDTIPQGSIVHVAGTPAPGHAVVVIADNLRLWPVYPATLRLRPLRL